MESDDVHAKILRHIGSCEWGWNFEMLGGFH
jgi:hypothetical protein